MDDSLIAVRDVGMLGRGDAPRGMLHEGCFAREIREGRGRYVAVSLCRPVAVSPRRARRPVAASPRRRVAPSPYHPTHHPVRLLRLRRARARRVDHRDRDEHGRVNLYRGESADGPFDVKVNEQMIPPAADLITGGDYQYVDKTAEPGVTDYYKLEEVEQAVARTALPRQRARAG